MAAGTDDSSVVITTEVIYDGAHSSAQSWVMTTGKVLTIGRAEISDVRVPLRGISNVHAELRLSLCHEAGAVDERSPKFCVRDVSTNGTAMVLEGGEECRLHKGVDVELPEIVDILMPLKVKDGDTRATIKLRIEPGTGESMPSDQCADDLSADSQTSRSGGACPSNVCQPQDEDVDVCAASPEPAASPQTSIHEPTRIGAFERTGMSGDIARPQTAAIATAAATADMVTSEVRVTSQDASTLSEATIQPSKIPPQPPWRPSNGATTATVGASSMKKGASERPRCVFFSQGQCFLGEKCLLSHVADKQVIAPALPKIAPPVGTSPEKPKASCGGHVGSAGSGRTMQDSQSFSPPMPCVAAESQTKKIPNAGIGGSPVPQSQSLPSISSGLVGSSASTQDRVQQHELKEHQPISQSAAQSHTPPATPPPRVVTGERKGGKGIRMPAAMSTVTDIAHQATSSAGVSSPNSSMTSPHGLGTICRPRGPRPSLPMPRIPVVASCCGGGVAVDSMTWAPPKAASSTVPNRPAFSVTPFVVDDSSALHGSGAGGSMVSKPVVTMPGLATNVSSTLVEGEQREKWTSSARAEVPTASAVVTTNSTSGYAHGMLVAGSSVRTLTSYVPRPVAVCSVPAVAASMSNSVVDGKVTQAMPTFATRTSSAVIPSGVAVAVIPPPPKETTDRGVCGEYRSPLETEASKASNTFAGGRDVTVLTTSPMAESSSTGAATCGNDAAALVATTSPDTLNIAVLAPPTRPPVMTNASVGGVGVGALTPSTSADGAIAGLCDEATGGAPMTRAALEMSSPTAVACPRAALVAANTLLGGVKTGTSVSRAAPEMSTPAGIWKVALEAAINRAGVTNPGASFSRAAAETSHPASIACPQAALEAAKTLFGGLATAASTPKATSVMTSGARVGGNAAVLESGAATEPVQEHGAPRVDVPTPEAKAPFVPASRPFVSGVRGGIAEPPLPNILNQQHQTGSPVKAAMTAFCTDKDFSAKLGTVSTPSVTRNVAEVVGDRSAAAAAEHPSACAGDQDHDKMKHMLPTAAQSPQGSRQQEHAPGSAREGQPTACGPVSGVTLEASVAGCPEPQHDEPRARSRSPQPVAVETRPEASAMSSRRTSENDPSGSRLGKASRKHQRRDEESAGLEASSRKFGQHSFYVDRCMVCVSCFFCTGYGPKCVKNDPEKARRGPCGCGPATTRRDSGCKHCGFCRHCAARHPCVPDGQDRPSRQERLSRNSEATMGTASTSTARGPDPSCNTHDLPNRSSSGEKHRSRSRETKRGVKDAGGSASVQGNPSEEVASSGEVILNNPEVASETNHVRESAAHVAPVDSAIPVGAPEVVPKSHPPVETTAPSVFSVGDLEQGPRVKVSFESEGLHSHESERSRSRDHLNAPNESRGRERSRSRNQAHTTPTSQTVVATDSLVAVEPVSAVSVALSSSASCKPSAEATESRSGYRASYQVCNAPDSGSTYPTVASLAPAASTVLASSCVERGQGFGVKASDEISDLHSRSLDHVRSRDQTQCATNRTEPLASFAPAEPAVFAPSPSYSGSGYHGLHSGDWQRNCSQAQLNQDVIGRRGDSVDGVSDGSCAWSVGAPPWNSWSRPYPEREAAAAQPATDAAGEGQIRVNGALEKPRTPPPPPPPPKRKGTNSDLQQTNRLTVAEVEWYKVEIERLYTQYNPAKLKELSALFIKYSGGEHRLYEALYKKYVQPQQLNQQGHAIG